MSACRALLAGENAKILMISPLDGETYKPIKRLILLEAAAKNERLLLERALSREFGDLTEEDIGEALVKAATFGNNESLSRLLAEGIDPDYGDVDGDTALMKASANGYLDAVVMLLDVGSDVDMQNDKNRTALHKAVWWNRLPIVQVLLQAGCDITLKDTYNENALMLSSIKGYDHIMVLLLEHEDCDIDAQGDSKNTALHYAAQRGQTRCVTMLLKAGPKIDASSMWAYTPLHSATIEGQEDTAILLIEAGADIHAKCYSDRTPLHNAVRKCLYRCVDVLLQKGACPDVSDNYNNTPFFEAVKLNDFKMVRRLIQHGCNIDVMAKHTMCRKFSWHTPLEVALNNKSLKIACLVFEAGASITLSSLESECLQNALDDEIIQEWIFRVQGQPKNLSDLCRIAIKVYIGYSYIEKVQLLPLPPTIRQYLCYDNFSDMLEE